MDTVITDQPPLTADEFLARGGRAFGEGRFELVDGRVVAMAPTSDEHGIILANICRVIGTALGAAKLRCVMATGIGVRPARAPERVRIPDAVILCGEPRRPVVLFEILSPSNEGRDYEERFADLLTVDGVAEIVELAQDAAEARVHRHHEGGWRSSDVAGEKQKLEIQSLGISTRLGALYAGVDLRRK